jgi:circadian clock protein KaiB
MPDSTKEFEATLRDRDRRRYVLRLYIAGATPRSSQAVDNVKQICEEYLQGRYDLQVVDIYRNPVLAKGEQIVAVPTLIKRLPQPLRRFIGDLSDKERILVGLDLKPKRKTVSKGRSRESRKT